MIYKLFFDFLLKTLGQIIKEYLLHKYMNKNFLFKNLNRIKNFLARFKIQLYHKTKKILIQLYRFIILFIYLNFSFIFYLFQTYIFLNRF